MQASQMLGTTKRNHLANSRLTGALLQLLQGPGIAMRPADKSQLIHVAVHDPYNTSYLIHDGAVWRKLHMRALSKPG